MKRRINAGGDRSCRGAVKRAQIKKAPALLAGLFLLIGMGAPLSALDASLQGSFKTFLLGLFDPPPAYEKELYGSAENSLHLKARLYPSDILVFEGAYEIAPRVSPEDLGGAAASAFLSNAGDLREYRAFDFNSRLYPENATDEENLGIYHNLERLYGGVSLPFGDLYAGRQAISWGSAHIINPTDIIAPYGFTGLNTEEKRGVDALRLRMPLGAMAELDLGYAAGDEFRYDESLFYARGKGYAAGLDFSLLAMNYRENLLAGVDLTRSIGGAGAWIEAAYVLPGTFDFDGSSGAEIPEEYRSSGPDPELQYLTGSMGTDYNFGPKLYGYLEYHFNSAGKGKAEDYLEIESEPWKHPAYSEGSVSLLGRHYSGLGFNYQITPLLPLSGLVLLNINDLSANLSLSLEYNFTENVYIEGGVYLGIGEEPVTAGGIPVEYKSEFGAYPDLFYTAVKVYF
jgi:hypothetical protein